MLSSSTPTHTTLRVRDAEEEEEKGGYRKKESERGREGHSKPRSCREKAEGFSFFS